MDFTDIYGKLFKKSYDWNFTLNSVKSSFIIIKYYLYFYNGNLSLNLIFGMINF